MALSPHLARAQAYREELHYFKSSNPRPSNRESAHTDGNAPDVALHSGRESGRHRLYIDVRMYC